MNVEPNFDSSNIEMEDFSNIDSPPPSNSEIKGTIPNTPYEVEDITNQVNKMEIEHLDESGGLTKKLQNTAFKVAKHKNAIITGAGVIGLAVAAPIAVITGPVGITLFGLFAATVLTFGAHTAIRKWEEVDAGPQPKQPDDFMKKFKEHTSYADFTYHPQCEPMVSNLKKAKPEAQLVQLDKVYRELKEFNEVPTNKNKKLDLLKFPPSWIGKSKDEWKFDDNFKGTVPEAEQQNNFLQYWKQFTDLKELGDKKMFGF
ncbi:MAG: hypothetical protein VX777_04085 [Chlamydiota bacterium]|nr:hypothetical protein [Chlamydiota bacterium]